MEIDQRYEVIALDDDCPLKEHPQNPKIGAVEVIDESIEENGWFGAVVAQTSTGYILVGNHRYRVAKQRGASHIPVIWRDVDDETALRILLVDNKSADAGTYDEELLHQVLDSLVSLDGTGYGKVMHGLEERLAREADDEAAKEAAKDNPPEPEPIDPDTVLGDDRLTKQVPPDQYTPDWGIMVVCYSEDDQRRVYEALVELMRVVDADDDTPHAALRGDGDEPRKLRVVAV